MLYIFLMPIKKKFMNMSYPTVHYIIRIFVYKKALKTTKIDADENIYIKISKHSNCSFIIFFFFKYHHSMKYLYKVLGNFRVANINKEIARMLHKCYWIVT